MAYNRTKSASSLTLLGKASSAMALATGLALGASGTAFAQVAPPAGAYEGTPTVVSGGVVINRTTNTDTIQVDTTQAVINWTTNDMAIGGGLINFLPNGRTAIYRNNPSAQNQFTVLNRIIPNDPSRAIALNGTIISQLQTGAGLVQGGNVWFYSPGGIVVGATGVIDVGGLLLTSADPVRDGAGNFINAGGSFTLGGATSPTSFVQIDPGALVRATPQNSYIAMVAPIVRQNGTVNVNGSALMVGAEAATITFGTNGLFDIQVTTGTNGFGTAGEAITHGGTTGGPASTGAGDNHRIYMVAVPKNNAITMAITGTSQLGFDIAGAADVVGNSIILSSGYNVFGNTIDTSAPVNAAQQARISITNADFTSALTAAAATQFDVRSTPNNAMSFAGRVDVFARERATILASGTNSSINFANDLVMSTNAVATNGADATGGVTQLSAFSGGLVNVAGNVTITADARGGDNFSTGAVGSGTGGLAVLSPQGGGRIQIGGNATLSADGFAGNGGTGTGSNFGRGGQVIVTSLTLSNSNLQINGNLLANANGIGSNDFGTGTAGAGFGGSINVLAGNTTGTAGTGNTISILGTAVLNADGFGGNSAFGSGGIGNGGQVTFGSSAGGSTSITGNLQLSGFGFGGSSTFATGAGGVGTGGIAQFGVFSPGGVTAAAANVLLQASGSGGSGTATGGNATGGTAQMLINGDGGSISVGGTSTVQSLGLGGQGRIGGNGTGGQALVNTITSGTMTLNNALTISAGGIGGNATTAGQGGSGNGRGGTAQIVALANGVINVTGVVDINANGSVFGSALTGIDGGDGIGGNASISQNTGGQITITGSAAVKATGSGDRNQGGGDGIAGNGVGGDARIAVNDRTITITGDATVEALGFGGGALGGIRGGTGTGGLANLGAGAGTLSIGGVGTATADGIGGSSSGPGSGGDGIGGQAIIGAIPGGIIQIASAAIGSAQGFGGNASGAGNVGGMGTGGTTQMFANSGSLTVGGVTALNSSGFGGSVGNGASSGAALGGLISVISQGTGQVTLNQNVFLSAQGLSGNVDSGAGNSAAATGGRVTVNAFDAGSAITVNASIFADAIAGTGSAVTGTIGNALGGFALIESISGNFTATGAVSLDASAFGGASTLTGDGGNATGGRTAVVVFGAGGANINIGDSVTLVANGFGGSAQNGNGGIGTGGLSEAGTINVVGTFAFGGNSSLSASGFGGASLISGNGGNGVGGRSAFGVNRASMTGRDLFISAVARGGDGALGGRGGDATGGIATLVSGPGTTIGLVDFDNVFMFADAFGGAGGVGASAATGGTGGAGGNAIGGRVEAFGTARNGQLDIGNLQVTMNGFGGAGGAGGIGTAGAGGAGGAGGIGTGGSTQLGTISSTITTGVNPTPTGFMTMADAFVEASGFGGAGGAGGTGTTVSGNGGVGGLGDAGDIFIGARGSLVRSNALTLIADGIGGNGGAGATQGIGGNGIGGTIGVESTEQFMAPGNRGTLTVGNLLALARGTGGAGSVAGQSFYETGSFFRAVNGDVTASSIVFNIGGTTAEPTNAIQDVVRISDGTVNAGSSFTFVTPNSLSVLVNNGALNASAVGLSAGTFVLDTVITAPTNIGSINTGSLALTSAGNVIVTANLAATQNVSISSSSAVTFGNINAGGVIGITGSSLSLGNLVSGNHINLTSTSGAISAGTVTAANFIAMTAANGLTLGLATATNGYIDLLVQSGNLTVGNLTAGTFIVLDTRAGNVVMGDTRSGAETEVESAGSVQFGNAISGLEFSVEAIGNVAGGNVTASGAVPTTTFSVGLLSQTGSIAVGNLSGARNVGFLSPGTITAGSVTSGENVIVLGIGNVQFNGPVTTGTGPTNFLYFGNASMASLLGADFNPAPLFGVAPVRTAGSFTVGGAIQAGNVLAGVGTALQVNGGITATGGRIGLTANSITAQNLSSTLVTSLNATAGNIAVGSVTAGGAVGLVANAGQITSGLITGATVGVDGQGPVSIGGVTTTGAANMRSVASTFTSTGAITAASVGIGGIGVALGNVTTTSGQIGIAAGAGNLSFGAMTSATNTQFSAGGSVTGGDLTAGTWMGSIVGGNLTLGNLRTSGAGTSANGFSIGLGANGTVVTGTINSFGLLGIGSDDGQGNLGNSGSITTGAITAGGSVLLRSTQGLTTGAIGSTNEIRVRGGTVTTGALTATNAILAAAMTGGLSTGAVTTGTSALLLGAQSVNTGAISTGSTGTAFIGNSSVIPATGLISTINLTTLLAATPVRVGGSVSIGGPVTTANLLTASTGSFSASSTITAGTRIAIDAGGTAVFGGLAAAPTITVSSGDIAFSQNGGLGNANTGSLTLTATGSQGAILGGTSGDSQSSTGRYLLDGSEIQRLRAQNITFSAPNVSSTGSGIEIRAFTLNGSTATSGSNLNGSEGSFTISTPGAIRVNGNAIFNAMAPTNRVALNGARVEINADTGGFFLNGSSPGGVLTITANNIHIASGSLLERLAENINFTGRDTALGVPIATARPDGVIQASRLVFNVGSTLLIQNTGTSTLNAGFFGRVGSFEIVPRSSSSQSTSSPIDLVIYGQLLDTGDVVRNGTSVRDLIFPRSTSTGGDTSSPITGFTTNSSVNGCLINAPACFGAAGGVDVAAPTTVVHAGPPPPQAAAEREAQRDQDDAEAAAEEDARDEGAPRRPIMPPVNIVNTRRLGVEPIIDEPVTSGGNPNLQIDQPIPDAGGQP